MNLAEAQAKIREWYAKGNSRNDAVILTAALELNGDSEAAFQYINLIYQQTQVLIDPHLSDSTNAELLAMLYKERLRYDHQRDRWLIWNKHSWKEDVDGEIYRLATEAARERYKQSVNIPDLKERQRAAKWAIDSEQRSRLESAISLTQNIKPIADSGKSWDQNPWLFAVSNGVIDLQKGELRTGAPEDCITLSSPVIYNSAAQCPRWIQFLDEIFNEDGELIHWLQMALGYSLTGLTTEQVCFICHGSGANGKTVFLSTLRHVLGESAYDAPFSTFELTSRAAIPNDLAALERRRFVTSSETNEGTRINEARIKALTGGDSCTARYLHQEYFTFQPAAKYWLGVNHRPRVQDDSFGFWRRVRLIPFNQQFQGEAEDKALLDKLKAEGPGILNWLILGCLFWQQEGLSNIPAAIKQSTADYKADSDPLADFLTARCVLSAKASVAASDLYQDYQAWSKEQGMSTDEALTVTTFGRKIGNKFTRVRSGKGKLYQGLGLLSGFHVGMNV